MSVVTPTGNTMAAQPETLKHELETFKSLLSTTLAGEEGRYALVADSELLGVFDTYADALDAGYKERGLEPFLVKQVAAVELVANFTRHIKPAAWHTSP